VNLHVEPAEVIDILLIISGEGGIGVLSDFHGHWIFKILLNKFKNYLQI
jgi:hypothetical protein